MSASDRVFLDSNVLVYCDDPRDPVKQSRATDVYAELTRSSRAVVSTQVLQEVFATATRKLHLSAEVARARVELLAQLDVVVVRTELILGAIDLHRLHGISFWDALIVRCASAAGCRRIYTEDMNHGQVIDGVRIENPFLATATRASESGARWPTPRRTSRRRQAGR